MARSYRRGFSLIELLVVMAIILILMGIGVLAYQHIEKVAGEKSTMTRLEMCASMLHEYDVSASLAAIEGPGGMYPASGLPRSLFYKGVGATVSSPPLANPGSVADGSTNRNPVVIMPIAPSGSTWTPMNSPGAVQLTGMVFQAFQQVPSVKLMLAQIPGGAMLTSYGASGTGQASLPYMDNTVDGNGTAQAPQPLPVILDGWNNPIIYVPSGGLVNVWVGGPPPNGNLSVDPNVHLYTVTSVDGRPFWASAGADGSFSSGDDNLYSCPVRLTKQVGSP